MVSHQMKYNLFQQRIVSARRGIARQLRDYCRDIPPAGSRWPGDNQRGARRKHSVSRHESPEPVIIIHPAKGMMMMTNTVHFIDLIFSRSNGLETCGEKYSFVRVTCGTRFVQVCQTAQTVKSCCRSDCTRPGESGIRGTCQRIDGSGVLSWVCVASTNKHDY